MKNVMTSFMLVVTSVLFLVGCGGGDSTTSETGSEATEIFTAGTFRGEADAWGNSPIVLDVEFSETEILRIEIVSHDETPGLSDPAFAQVPDQIIENQTLMVDAVTGATVTSDAIVNAVTEAVLAAGGNVEDLMS